MEASSFEFFKGLFQKEDCFMKKLQNLTIVPPELDIGEDKSYLIKSFLLQDILNEKFQRQNFKIAQLSLGFVEIFLAKVNDPHQKFKLLQYAAISIAAKLEKFDDLERVLQEIQDEGISFVKLGLMELKIWKNLGYQSDFVTFTDFLLAFRNLSPSLTDFFDSTNFELNIQAFYFSFVEKYGILRFKSSSIFFICLLEFLPFYGFDLPDSDANFLDIKLFDKEEIQNCYHIVIESLNAFLYSNEEAVPIESLEGIIALPTDKNEDDEKLLLCHEKLTFE